MSFQYVLITGASSGLGREMTLEFVRKGYRVFAGVRRAEDQERLEAEIPGSIPLLLDLLRPESWEAAIEQVGRTLGSRSLSALINNAGFSNFAPLEYTDESEGRTILDVNFFAPFRLTQRLLPFMKNRGMPGGLAPKVINIISWAAIMPAPWNGFYYASKAALLAMTETQYYEFGQIGIDTVAILPGLMRTAFMKKSEKELLRGISNLPKEADAYYGSSMRHILQVAKTSSTNPIVSDPQKIAAKIVSIATRSGTKFKYHLGLDSKIVGLMVKLPFGFRRTMNRSIFRLNEGVPS